VYPAVFAEAAPERPAVIAADTGQALTYRQLDDESKQLANLFRERGLLPRGRIALLMDNDVRFLVVAWAAQRAGLYYTPINPRLTWREMSYIVRDSGAVAVVASASTAGIVSRLGPDDMPSVRTRVMVGATASGWECYESVVSRQPCTTPPDECEGDALLYSSGTTGRPKGIKRPLTLAPMGHGPDGAGLLLDRLSMTEGDVYLCPAPLSHSAPLTSSLAAHRRGATVVTMSRFDPAHALAHIERHGVTHSQWVPTMFARMLKLPEAERRGSDLSTHRAALHGAAPCPLHVKRAMLEWWGPILHEYYSCTEGIGVTFITPHEWLERPGSVGRPLVGDARIRDDSGNELGAGEVGTVWFSGGYAFRYHNDEPNNASSHRPHGGTTVGDVGYMDADGYLYLTDRKQFVIVSGGVNVYPREVEDVLMAHPKVADVAVFGVPNEDLGEEVKAVVLPVSGTDAREDLGGELITFCRDHLAGFKCPRSVEFIPRMPRDYMGKLPKADLRARYWPRG
jgi:long-chain acyl-CoA synthetase